MYFIQKEIIHFPVGHSGVDVFAQFFGIAPFSAAADVKGYLNDVIFFDTVMDQEVVENIIQKIGLTATPDAGNDFDETVMTSHLDPVQVKIPFDFHS